MSSHQPRASRPDVVRRLLLLCGVVCSLLCSLALSLAMGTSPAGASTHSSAPTYSPPIWLPVHSGFGVDCAGRNPGCTSKRQFYSIDIVPSGQFGPDGAPSKAVVYAMGAGTLHIGNPHGTACGSTPQGSFGTWVWIQHGDHVESRYGHLSRILAKNGSHVSAGTPIGVVGATGKAVNCSVNYLDFEIIHGKLTNANAYRFDTVQACTVGGERQTWPAQAASTLKPGNHTPVHFSIWGDVPHGTQFPASSGSCVSG